MADQRTSVLWMEYIKMIDILKRFIKAERTGDWKLHLQAVHDMRPYFAASGHNQYAKSAHIYLQMMHDLENTLVYKSFMSGLHVVRRSDRLWAGLSTDLVIEQVFNETMYILFIYEKAFTRLQVCTKQNSIFTPIIFH